jgi:hypothetical protein
MLPHRLQVIRSLCAVPDLPFPTTRRLFSLRRAGHLFPDNAAPPSRRPIEAINAARIARWRSTHASEPDWTQTRFTTMANANRCPSFTGALQEEESCRPSDGIKAFIVKGLACYDALPIGRGRKANCTAGGAAPPGCCVCASLEVRQHRQDTDGLKNRVGR